MKMTPSNAVPSDPQVGKLHERLLSATRKSGVTTQQFQIALAYPGTELEDGLLSVIVRFVKKAAGIITPVRAQETDLIPDGWSVEIDSLEGDVDLSKLDYSTCPVQPGDGGYIGGDTMLGRAGNAYGSLGFTAALLKAQAEGKEILPVESRGKHYFIMSRTILLDDDRGRRVAFFGWDGRQWALDFGYLVNDFGGRGRFVRPRELPSGA